MNATSPLRTLLLAGTLCGAANLCLEWSVVWAETPARAPLFEPADDLSTATGQVEDLARTGDESAVLVGVATPAQRARVAAVARDALTRLQQVEMELSGKIARMMNIDPVKAREIRAADLNLRLPLLRARAGVLLGVAERDAARLAGAIETLETVDPLAVAPAALRRHLLALALYHRALLHGVRPGSPDADLSRAIDILRSMNDWPIGADANTMRPPSLAAETWFAQVRIATHASGSPVIAQRAGEVENKPPFVSETESQLADPGLFVRHAEVRAASLATLFVASPGKLTFDAVTAPIKEGVRPERMAATGRGARATQQQQADAERTRSWLIGRIAAAIIEQGGSQLELPASAVVVAGAELAREPMSRPRAVTMLDALLNRPDVQPVLADALFFSVVAMSDSTLPAERVELVRRANRSIEAGLKEPRRSALLGALPGEAARAVKAAEGDEKLLAEAMDVRVKALQLASHGLPHSTSGATGVQLAAALITQAGKDPQGVASINAATLAGVLEALHDINTQQAKDIAAGAIDASITRARGLLQGAADPSFGAGELVRAAQLGVQWFAGSDNYRSALCKVALAEGYAATGDKRAVDLFRELLAVEPPPESPMVLTLDLARAQRASGDQAGAFATLRSMVELIEPSPVKPPEFFEAWADMLEILAANNPTGSRNPQITLRIQHLRSLDPKLGTAETAERMELVEQSLKR